MWQPAPVTKNWYWLPKLVLLFQRALKWNFRQAIEKLRGWSDWQNCGWSNSLQRRGCYLKNACESLSRRLTVCKFQGPFVSLCFQLDLRCSPHQAPPKTWRAGRRLIPDPRATQYSRIPRHPVQNLRFPAIPEFAARVGSLVTHSNPGST